MIPWTSKTITLSDKISADKIFGGQNFRHQVEILAVLSDEFFSSVSYFFIQFTTKICFNMKFVLI